MTPSKGRFRLWRDPSLLTRRNLWLFFRYAVLYALIVHVGLGAVAAVRNHRTRGAEYGAILISGQAFTKYDRYWASPAAAFGAYPYWTAYFNNRGMKARWFVGAKSADLENAVKDPNCVSIVLVGHGSFSLWEATDKDVSNEEMAAMMKGLPKKKGEWIQLTCGFDEGLPKLGTLVMEPDRVYTYEHTINAYYLVTDALFGFKYIKSLHTGSKH